MNISVQYRVPTKPASSSPKAAEARQPKSAEDVWTVSESFEFAMGGAKYNFDKAVASTQAAYSGGLSDQPRVQIERPLVLVHGFLGTGEQFQELVDHLTSDGINGGAPIYVNNGQFYSDPDCEKPTEATTDHKVFYMIHDREASPEGVADDLELTAKALKKTGHSQRFDIAAHSMGGLGARIFCDRGNKIHKLAMVGTPNQGSRAALLTKSALKNGIGWATSMASVTTAALGALEWMIPIVNGNEKLERLNSRWELQEQNMEQAIVLGAGDFVTLNPVESWGPGDGLIEEESLAVGDVPVWSFDGTGQKSHNYQMNDPDVFFGLTTFLDWQELSIH